MRHETLHDRAVSNFKCALHNYSIKDSDEFQLNITGYLLQQATELELKHRYEISGVKYPYTHDIKLLLNGLPKDKFPDNYETLFLFSDTLTNWESKTRYVKDYFLENKSIAIAFRIVSVLLGQSQQTETTYEFGKY